MDRRLRILSYAIRSVQVIISKEREGRGVTHARVPQGMLLLYIRRREDVPVQNYDVDYYVTEYKASICDFTRRATKHRFSQTYRIS